MLKLKNNVKLNELQKFGFTESNIMGDNVYIKEHINGYYKEYIIVWEDTKVIQTKSIRLLETIYELIQADLVEIREA